MLEPATRDFAGSIAFTSATRGLRTPIDVG